MMDRAKHTTIPAALLGIAVAIFCGFGFYAAGSKGVGVVLAALTAQLIVGVVLGIVACMIAASLLDISFGPIGQASLKLAAIFAFPMAVSLFIPGLGWLIAFVLYFALLAWLFELEGREVLICAVIIWVVRFAATMVGGAAAMA